jgi:hypothetical protein
VQGKARRTFEAYTWLHLSCHYLVVVVVAAAEFGAFLAGVVVVAFVAGIGFTGAAGGAAALGAFTGVFIAALFTTGLVAACAGIPAVGLLLTIRCCWLGTAVDVVANPGR